MRGVAALLVVLIVFGVSAWNVSATPVQTTCGTTSGGATRIVTGIKHAQGLGGLLNRLATDPALKDTALIHRNTDGVQHTIWLWIRSFYLAARGESEDPEVTELKQSVTPAADACTPAVACQPTTQDGPSVASVPTSGTGREMVEAAAAKVWPADQVPLAVAIAGAESTFNPDPPNPPVVGGSTMRGLWQINERAHPDVMRYGDWRDPDVNARMAYTVWLQAGKSWKPWSTYNSGSYRKFLKAPAGGVAVQAAATSSAPTLENCTGSVDATVATWNVQSNRDHDRGALGAATLSKVVNGAEELAQTADIINWQELADSSRRNQVEVAIRRAGHGMVDFGTATPLSYNMNKFKLLDSGRAQTLSSGVHVERGAGNRTVIGPKWLVWALLEPVDGGPAFYDVSQHQVATVERKGRWDPSNDRRVDAYTEQLGNAMGKVDEFAATGRPGFIGSDWNVTFDPDGTWAKHGLMWKDAGPTHGNRTIDRVLSWGTPPASTSVMSESGSDHRRVLTTYVRSVADAAAGASVASMRTVRSEGKSFQIPIPSGPAGVAVNYALDQIGKPYVWASTGPNSFDCSGLVSAAYKKAGVDVFPQTETMARQEPKATGADQPGDLWGHPGHVQMYLGVIDGKATVVEAANPRDDIRIDQSGWMHPTWKLRPTAEGN